MFTSKMALHESTQAHNPINNLSHEHKRPTNTLTVRPSIDLIQGRLLFHNACKSSNSHSLNCPISISQLHWWMKNKHYDSCIWFHAHCVVGVNYKFFSKSFKESTQCLLDVPRTSNSHLYWSILSICFKLQYLNYFGKR